MIFPWMQFGLSMANASLDVAQRMLEPPRPSAGRRGYDAAKPSKLSSGWRTPATSANREVLTGLPYLRARSRDLVRNHPHASRAIEVLETWSVGTGIRPRARTGDDDLDKRLGDWWAQFVEHSDVDGHDDFYGQQALVARTVGESGEVGFSFVPRHSHSGLPVPLQLQIFEGDHVDHTQTRELPDGGRVVMGVHLDESGRVRGYEIHPSHPGDYGLMSRGYATEFRSRDQMQLCFERLRPGQLRGVPRGVSAFLSARMSQDYEFAELDRKRLEASLAMVVRGMSPKEFESEDGALFPVMSDGEGNLFDRLEPGTIAYAMNAAEVEFPTVPASQGFVEFKRTQTQAIAAAYGLTYEMLSADVSQANYSSSRAGFLIAMRTVRRLQQNVVVRQFSQPVWNRMLDTLEALGHIPEGTPRTADWSLPPMPTVDPVKDAQADLMAVRSGQKTLFQVAAERGMDFRQMAAEMAAANALLDELGIVLDSDPRRVTRAGVDQFDDPRRDDVAQATTPAKPEV